MWGRTPRTIAACTLLPSSGSGRTSVNLAALLQFVLPIGYDNVAGRDSARDYRNVVLGEANGHVTHVHGVIRLHHKDISSLWTSLNRRCRNCGAVVPSFKQQAGIHELIGPQRVVFIVEYGFQSPGASG